MWDMLHMHIAPRIYTIQLHKIYVQQHRTFEQNQIRKWKFFDGNFHIMNKRWWNVEYSMLNRVLFEIANMMLLWLEYLNKNINVKHIWSQCMVDLFLAFSKKWWNQQKRSNIQRDLFLMNNAIQMILFVHQVHSLQSLLANSVLIKSDQ